MHASRAGEENGRRPVRGDSGSRGVDFGRMSVVEQAEKLLSSVLERTWRMFIRLGLSTSQLSPICPRSPLAQFRSSTSLGCTVVESTSSRVSNISSFTAVKSFSKTSKIDQFSLRPFGPGPGPAAARRPPRRRRRPRRPGPGPGTAGPGRRPTWPVRGRGRYFHRAARRTIMMGTSTRNLETSGTM